MYQTRNVALLSLGTHEDLHVIQPNEFAMSILFNKGNIRHPYRFVKLAKNFNNHHDDILKWTSLVGGSFALTHLENKAETQSLLIRSNTFPSSVKKKQQIQIPMQILETQVQCISNSMSQDLQDMKESSWFILMLFPIQWNDVKEIEQVITKVAKITNKRQPMGIISIGQDIEPCSTSMDYRWAHFQAKCHSIAYPLNLRLHFVRINIDPDEICDAIEAVWQKKI